MRKVFTIIISLLLLASLSEARSVKLDSRYGGKLTWGVSYKPTIINPILTTQSVSASLQSLIFNELIRLNAKGEIEPDLAESWDISEDGLIITFHLRKGVKFHDGVELTSQDVKFTFEKISDPQVNSPFRQFFKLAKEFTAPDNYTFKVILNKPSTSFIYRMIRPIAPKHLLENVDLKNAAFNYQPVGSGPFKFKSWDKDDQIILEYNPDYYEGRPFLDKIIIKTYADSRQLWSALMRQEVDLTMFIEREDYEVIKNDPAFKAYTIPVDCYYAIYYNLENPVLADLKVREAIAYGINKKNLIDKVAFGYGLECNGPFYPDSIGFNPQVEPIEFNPDKALQILAEAGWQDLNKDGILEKSGNDLEIRLLVDERSDLYHKMAMLLRQQLKEIGVKLIVQLYNDQAMLTKDFLEQNKTQAQLRLILAGADPDQMETQWFSQSPEKVYNLWNYDNFEVDRYFNLAKTTINENKRKWIYQEIYKFIYTDQPVCFLYYPLYFNIVNSKFTNTDDFFTVSMPCSTLRNWYIRIDNFREKGGD